MEKYKTRKKRKHNPRWSNKWTPNTCQIRDYWEKIRLTMYKVFEAPTTKSYNILADKIIKLTKTVSKMEATFLQKLEEEHNEKQP